jgi:hypothetical protein
MIRLSTKKELKAIARITQQAEYLAHLSDQPAKRKKIK